MLIFNKLRTQQALGRLEISNGSGGGSCCGGGLPSLALYLREGGAGGCSEGLEYLHSLNCTGTRSEEEVGGKAGRGGRERERDRGGSYDQMDKQELWSVGSSRNGV